MSARNASRSLADALPFSRSSRYICRRCRRDFQPLIQQRHYASTKSENKPEPEAPKRWEQRIREKLWQGQPPGPENVDDVYGGPGFFKTLKTERQERARKDKEQKAVEAEIAERDLQVEAEPQPPKTRDATRTRGRRTNVQSQDAIVHVKTRQSTNQSVSGEMTQQASATNIEYKEARTWDGLEFVGTDGNWRDIPAKQADDYEPWMVASKTPGWSFDELVSLMHQAIVECHACQQSKRDPKEASNLDAVGQLHLDYANVDIAVSDGCIQSINQSLEETKQPLGRPAGEDDLPQPRLLYQPQDIKFLEARLTDNVPMMFAILKRFSYLAGYRLPDPLLNMLYSGDPQENTIRALLTTIAKKIAPTPANIAERLMAEKKLAARDNLMIFGRRETSIDKEKEVGRWKLIEAELKARGLPVTGKVQVQRS